jgi:hypothetical protein
MNGIRKVLKDRLAIQWVICSGISSLFVAMQLMASRRCRRLQHGRGRGRRFPSIDPASFSDCA